MWSVFKKELSAFLNSLMGYMIMVLFLLFMGLMLWFFNSPENNIFQSGYASLQSMFFIAPWVFIFLLSAITMRMFSEEKRTGTLELLYTKPLTDWDIVLGKYISAFCLVIFSLIPTLVYGYVIYQLAEPIGNIDIPAIAGSYFGLFFLASGFASIGLFASSVNYNPIVSFLLSAFLCFLTYQGFEWMSEVSVLSNVDHLIKKIGIQEHYVSMSRGVIDTRDMVYFLSLTYLFLVLTKSRLESRKWQ